MEIVRPSPHRNLESDEIAVILDSVADGVFTVDGEFRVTSFNRAAEAITGVPREEALGRPCCEVFRASICEAQCALKETMHTGRPIVNRSVYILRPDGERAPISVSTALLKDRRGNIIGGVETFRDLRLVEQLRAEITGRYTFADVLSKNREMQRLFDILPQVAESDSTVLVEGDRGSDDSPGGRGADYQHVFRLWQARFRQQGGLLRIEVRADRVHAGPRHGTGAFWNHRQRHLPWTRRYRPDRLLRADNERRI